MHDVRHFAFRTSPNVCYVCSVAMPLLCSVVGFGHCSGRSVNDKGHEGFQCSKSPHFTFVTFRSLQIILDMHILPSILRKSDPSYFNS